MKKIVFGFLYILFVAILIEFCLVLALHFLKGYPIFNRETSLAKRFYPYTENFKDFNANNYNILILGGSAISNDLPAEIGNQLEVKLQNTFPNLKAKVYDIAKPAHNSRDSFFKLEVLKDYKFDLIVYYESINDVRHNCLPKNAFKSDYSHSNWYEEIEIFRRHPEFKYLVSPFVFDLFKENLKTMMGKKQMLNNELDIRPDFLVYGDSIKTHQPFENNIKNMLSIAQKKNTATVLLGYSVFIPKELYDHKNFGFDKEGKFFKAKGPRTTVGAWGYADNIDKTIKTHNQLLKQLSTEFVNTTYFDMDSTMAQHRDEYFDICHFTKTGGTYFSNQLVEVLKPIIQPATKNKIK